MTCVVLLGFFLRLGGLSIGWRFERGSQKGVQEDSRPTRPKHSIPPPQGATATWGGGWNGAGGGSPRRSGRPPWPTAPAPPRCRTRRTGRSCTCPSRFPPGPTLLVVTGPPGFLTNEVGGSSLKDEDTNPLFLLPLKTHTQTSTHCKHPPTRTPETWHQQASTKQGTYCGGFPGLGILPSQQRFWPQTKPVPKGSWIQNFPPCTYVFHRS